MSEKRNVQIERLCLEALTRCNWIRSRIQSDDVYGMTDLTYLVGRLRRWAGILERCRRLLGNGAALMPLVDRHWAGCCDRSEVCVCREPAVHA